MSLYAKLPIAVAGLGTAITAWLGGWDVALRALLVFMLIDYVSGFLAAAKQRHINSEVMFWGGIRKASILVVVIIGVLLDSLVDLHTPIFRTLFVYYYVAREGLSIVENMGLLGIPLPASLARALEQLNLEGEIASNSPEPREEDTHGSNSV